MQNIYVHVALQVSLFSTHCPMTHFVICQAECASWQQNKLECSIIGILYSVLACVVLTLQFPALQHVLLALPRALGRCSKLIMTLMKSTTALASLIIIIIIMNCQC